MSTFSNNPSIQEIAHICRSDLKFPSSKIDRIVKYISAMYIETKSKSNTERLPKNLTVGFAPIDYLISPLNPSTRIAIYGNPQTAKTSITVKLLKGIIEKHVNTHIIWVDSTFKLDKSFLSKFKFGDSLKIMSTADIEKVHQLIVEDDLYNVVVLDDVASFSNNYETMKYINRILYYCKTENILAIAIDQIRDDIRKGSRYLAKKDLWGNYDIILRTMKNSNHYDANIPYTDYDIKAEFYHADGELRNNKVTIPIKTNGIIREELANKRIEQKIKVEGFNDIDSLIKYRQSIRENSETE